MSNRFGHIKNRNKDVESFIEGANEPKQAKQAQTQENDQQHILLSISSRMSRDEECKKPVLLHIKKDIASDIDKHCHGNKQAILNYLLRRGLDAVVEDGKLILM
jgi:hypothetical protein